MAGKASKHGGGKAATRTGRWRPKFLKALAMTGNVSESATVAGVGRTAAYAAREADQAFAAQWDDAIAQACDVLESEARRRAVDGVDEPVIHLGELSGYWVNAKGRRIPEKTATTTPNARFIPLTVKKYSDTLLIFLMKGANPGKYREHYHHTHDGDVKLKPVDGAATADQILAGLLQRLGNPGQAV